MGIQNRLLPCPFCGGEAFTTKRGSRFGTMCFVQCSVCGAQTRVKNCKKSVESDDWNDGGLLVVESLWNNRISKKE